MTRAGPVRIVGIDAAWTVKQPTGVALVELDGTAARLVSVARSYGEVIENETRWRKRPRRHEETPEAALEVLAPYDVVAVDMPLQVAPIVSRRASDTAVSKAYGARWASVHSPIPERPGPIAAELFALLRRHGLAFVAADKSAGGVADGAAGAGGVFLETYPHAAIIELMGLEKRLPYKVGNRRKFWRDEPSSRTWILVAEQMDRLRAALDAVIEGVTDQVPSAVELLETGARPRGTVLKGLEDALDAVVCAWAGVQWWRGAALAHGDEVSAIWVPAGVD